MAHFAGFVCLGLWVCASGSVCLWRSVDVQ